MSPQEQYSEDRWCKVMWFWWDNCSISLLRPLPEENQRAPAGYQGTLWKGPNLSRNCLVLYGALPTLSLLLALEEAGPCPQGCFFSRVVTSDTKTLCWWLIYISEILIRRWHLIIIGSTVLSCVGRQSLVIPKIKTFCISLASQCMLDFCFFFFKWSSFGPCKTDPCYLFLNSIWDNHKQLLDMSHSRECKADNCVTIGPKTRQTLTWWCSSEGKKAIFTKV